MSINLSPFSEYPRGGLPARMSSNVVDYICGRMCSWGDRTAQIDAVTGQRISFNQVLKAVATTKRKLMAEGVGTGSVVGLCAENCLEYVGVLLAALDLGASAALFSTLSKSRELVHLLNQSRPTLIYSHNPSDEHKLAFDSFPETRVVHWSLAEILQDEGSHQWAKEPPAEEFNEIALLLASSGTTGLPKTVAISHANLISSLENLSHILMEEGSTTLGMLPFFHAYGIGLMLMALCEGTTMVLVPKYNDKIFEDTIFTHKITRYHTVSTFIIKFNDGSIDLTKMKSLRYIFTSGCMANPKLQAAILNKIGNQVKMVHMFGMTELTHVVTWEEVDYSRPWSVGQVLPFMKAKIIDSKGETLGKGKHGELCISGPTVMLGYYGDKETTDKSITPDGWLRTGDLAWVDNEDHIYIVDRMKDIIKCQGYQVSATELEQVIGELAGVKEVAIVAVPHEIYTEVPRAFVVRETDKINEQEIIDAVEKSLSHYKRLRGGVRFIDSIPKSPLLKPMKKMLVNS